MYNLCRIVNERFIQFSVSDYVGGGELLKLLQDHGPLPEDLCRLYFAELVVIIGMYIHFYIIVDQILFVKAPVK